MRPSPIDRLNGLIHTSGSGIAFGDCSLAGSICQHHHTTVHIRTYEYSSYRPNDCWVVPVVERPITRPPDPRGWLPWERSRRFTASHRLLYTAFRIPILWSHPVGRRVKYSHALSLSTIRAWWILLCEVNNAKMDCYHRLVVHPGEVSASTVATRLWRRRYTTAWRLLVVSSVGRMSGDHVNRRAVDGPAASPHVTCRDCMSDVGFERWYVIGNKDYGLSEFILDICIYTGCEPCEPCSRPIRSSTIYSASACGCLRSSRRQRS